MTTTDTTPEPLRLAAGRYYRTRDGIKVGPAKDRLEAIEKERNGAK